MNQPTTVSFSERLASLREAHAAHLAKPNRAVEETSGLYARYAEPVVTRGHIPLEWRFDLSRETNPFLLERLPVNSAFNPGAMEWNGKILLMIRVEGHDRKSFFAAAESETGVDGFRFRDEPVVMPETGDPDINVYDMRLTHHQDGWIYGLFCTERKDPKAPPGDLSSARAQCGIARTRDLKTWERLPDLVSRSPQQRNVVLHPKFVEGRYALYTRPQDDFIDAGSGGGIGFALCEDMTRAEIGDERIIDERIYHTVKELKNGEGPPPLKCAEGWIHIAHGVRGTAAGLRYVLYCYMTALDDPSRVIHRPGGAFLVPEGAERVGDTSNVAFCNGAVTREDGTVLIYYASSDTRCHVATTTLDVLSDYCRNTPEDPLRSADCVQQRLELIRRNRGR